MTRWIFFYYLVLGGCLLPRVGAADEYELCVAAAIDSIQQFQGARGNAISRAQAERFARKLVARNATLDKTPDDVWSTNVRHDIMSRLQLRAKRTLPLSENRGYLHEFAGDLWTLGDQGDEYLDFAALAFLLNPGNFRGKVLRILSHANEECLAASGERDAHDYASTKPEDLVTILAGEGVAFSDFDAILVGGCKTGDKKAKDASPTAARLAEASGRPTIGSTAYMGYDGLLSLSVSTGDPLVFFTLRLAIYPFAALNSDLLVDNPWQLFLPPGTAVDWTNARQLWAALNEGMPLKNSTHPAWTQWHGTFTSPAAHPSGPVCAEFLAKFRAIVRPSHPTPLPAGIFPGL